MNKDKLDLYYKCLGLFVFAIGWQTLVGLGYYSMDAAVILCGIVLSFFSTIVLTVNIAIFLMLYFILSFHHDIYYDFFEQHRIYYYFILPVLATTLASIKHKKPINTSMMLLFFVSLTININTFSYLAITYIQPTSKELIAKNITFDVKITKSYRSDKKRVFNDEYSLSTRPYIRLDKTFKAETNRKIVGDLYFSSTKSGNYKTYLLCNEKNECQPLERIQH